MKLTDKRIVLKRIKSAMSRVRAEIADNAAGGFIAGGLANEGFAGGYFQALCDVEAALVHGFPSDPRYYWPPAARATPEPRARKVE